VQPCTSTLSSLSDLFIVRVLHVELIELFFCDQVWRTRHDVLGRRRFWECDDVTNVLRSAQEHAPTVKAHCEPAVRWGTVLECVHEEAKFVLGFFIGQAEGLKRVTVETRDLFRQPIRADELNRFDAAIIDPPRPGAAAQCDEIAKSALKTVGFVSCNPITFARDAKTLTDAGFVLDWIEVIDQFRWSTHVEIAARFLRV